MFDKTSTYTLDIHPLVERISLVCKQEDIPGFMLFQNDNSEFWTSAINLKDKDMLGMMLEYVFNGFEDEKNSDLSSLIVSRFTDVICNSQEPLSSKFDSIIESMIKSAQSNGHDSLFMSALGIPKSPSLDEVLIKNGHPSKNQKKEEGS